MKGNVKVTQKCFITVTAVSSRFRSNGNVFIDDVVTPPERKKKLKCP